MKENENENGAQTGRGVTPAPRYQETTGRIII